MGGRDDGQAGRSLVSPGHAGGLGGKVAGAVLVLVGDFAVALGGLLLQTGLDNVSLLFADGHTPLQLLLHGGIVGDEAGG